jgi:periplasmic protein CpxP/Spy
LKKPLILPAALALVLGTTAFTSGYAQTPAPSSQAPTATAPQQPGTAAQQAQPRRDRDRMQGRDDHRRLDFTARAEARIAYVKAELKITSAQQAAFDRYAQVIRDNAASMQKNFQNMHGQRKDMTAIDRVEQRAKMAQARDQYEQQYLGAFKPLYTSLSADQKKVADDLATPHFGHGFRGHRPGGPGGSGPGRG